MNPRPTRRVVAAAVFLGFAMTIGSGAQIPLLGVEAALGKRERWARLDLSFADGPHGRLAHDDARQRSTRDGTRAQADMSQP